MIRYQIILVNRLQKYLDRVKKIKPLYSKKVLKNNYMYRLPNTQRNGRLRLYAIWNYDGYVKNVYYFKRTKSNTN